MTPSLNTRARLDRAARNNVPLQSATETFRKFKWFTLAVAILFPIYPSLSLIGSDATAHGADYDESSIITAYSDDSLGDSSYFSENGLIALDGTLSENPVRETIASSTGAEIESVEQADHKRSPEIMRYTIKTGDTLAKISDRYNVSIDAIRWANDISLDTLKPGLVIKVPPTSGVIHIVKKWDTLGGIAAKYDIAARDIASFNQLSDRDSLRIGKELMIPGAQKNAPIATLLKTPPVTNPRTVTPVPQPKPTTRPVTVDASGLKSSYAVVYTGKGRGFVWGNCTWYVAQNKSVTWRGNAIAWMKNARAQGIKTGSIPVPGAIIQFSGRGYSRAYGHVGIVADVTDDYVIVKDMNYRGLYEVTIRKVKKNDPAIDGYIYVD